MQLRNRDTQTRVKHQILSDYMDDWAGIIINGLAWRPNRPPSPRFVYVDACSYMGRYLGDTGDLLVGRVPDTPTWGSPILGIQALDRARAFARQRHGYDVTINAVLIEKEPDRFRELRHSLDLAGFTDRLEVNPTVFPSASGRIAVTRGDFNDYLDQILEYISRPYTWSFIFLDPYGPVAIPYSAVSQLIAQRNCDVMINFPYYDLHKKQGLLRRGSRTPGDEAILENYDRMFGTDKWRERCQAAYEAPGPTNPSQRIENELASFYLERLEQADPTLVVKHKRLLFADRDCPVFYLFLTTHDPSGALALNQVLKDADLSEHELKWHFQQDRWQAKSHQFGQRTLLDLGISASPPPAKSQTSMIDGESLGVDILEEFQGRTVQKRSIYRFLANSNVLAQDVSRALTSLKRRKLARYESNSKLSDMIEFVGKGGAP